MADDSYDITIIGGGILGLATARSLQERTPALKMAILEKESAPAEHQTAHNSGVLHTGIYYRPGSLKADLCVRGGRAMFRFCKESGIPLQVCGKVVVATRSDEIPALENLYQRGLANNVRDLGLIGPERLRELEPHASGMRALHVPTAAIVDFALVAKTFAKQFLAQGGTLRTGCRWLKILQHPDDRGNGKTFQLLTTQGEIQSRFLINCGGLFADRIARRSGTPPQCQIIPFRGEYFELVPEKRAWVRGLIYPVPNPDLPFLGVHLSRRIDDRVEVGPNAVLALKREGYRKWDLSLSDALETLIYPGFWRMATRYGRIGLQEWIRSMNRTAFLQAARRLVPGLEAKDLVPAGSGVRAQALNRSGVLLDDFKIIRGPRTLHLINAPSPAATASLAIGETVAQTAARQFGF